MIRVETSAVFLDLNAYPALGGATRLAAIATYTE